jgi:glycosyltransferase involved in cell wall biosynthesis
MRKTKIFFAYKHIEKPGGGANNFIRSLYEEIGKSSEFVVSNKDSSRSDILFFNQLSRGQGNEKVRGDKRYFLSEIKKLKKKTGAKLIVRPVNLKIQYDHPKGLKSWIYYFLHNFFLDVAIIRLVNIADFVIFQSNYQKIFFKRWGYKGTSNTVIHNGSSPIFEKSCSGEHEIHNPIRIVSTSSSSKKVKKCELIAKISLLEGVEVIHIGNWPEKIKNHKINIKGILNHEQIASIYRNADYFLHPAVLDVCPNAVIEALYAGLPVIYNGGVGGSPEIVMGNGIEVNEENLGETINLAKNKYNMLRKKLLEDRSYYSIKRATSQYLDIFNKFKK